MYNIQKGALLWLCSGN